VKPEPLVRVVFDDTVSREDAEVVLRYLSAVYREAGGNGLAVVGSPEPPEPEKGIP
jgi:hypothetical protein